MAVDDGEVALRLEKLHYVFAFAGELRPAGGGVGILFEAAEAAPFKFEVDLAEFVARSFENFEFLAVKSDRGRTVHERLAKDRKNSVFEGHRQIVRQRKTVARPRFMISELYSSTHLQRRQARRGRKVDKSNAVREAVERLGRLRALSTRVSA